MPDVKTLSTRGGDFIVEPASYLRNLTSGTITMPSSGEPHTLTSVVAYPLLASNILAVQGDEASVIAFVVFGKTFEDLDDDATTDTNIPYTIIDSYSGVVLNQSAIPTTDINGAAWTGGVAAIVTAIEALTPFPRFVTDPTKSTAADN